MPTRPFGALISQASAPWCSLPWTWSSFRDGVGNGLGYALILVIVGAVRELLGRGSLLGFQLIPEGAYDFGYVNNGMMTMPAMALILVGCVIWVHRAYIYKEEK